MADEDNKDDAALADDWASALAESAADTPEPDTASPGSALPVGGGAEPAHFQSFENEAVPPASEDVNLEAIMDIPVTISMEIGRTSINIRNLLQLNQGSVVELDRLAGEPMDVLVNGTLIAHGEVVVVNEKFGIRLTDVISPTERIKKLK